MMHWLQIRALRWALSVMESRPPDHVIDPEYLRRWYLFRRNRWCNLYIHYYTGSDDVRAMHDHPFASLSWLLSGMLIEHDDQGAHRITEGRWRIRRATYRHRLELVSSRAVTVFLHGPRVREWYFHCADGMRHWKRYIERGGCE